MSLGWLLVYPLRGQGGALLLILAVGLYLLLAAFAWSQAYDAVNVNMLMLSFLPIPALIVLGLFHHYAWASLRHVAAGNTQTIRSIEIEEVSPLANYLAFKVALLLLGLAGMVAWCFSISGLFGTGVVIVIGGVLPAVLGVIVLDERFLDGLDPNRLTQFVTGLGPAYIMFALSMYGGMATLYVVSFVMSPPNIVAVLIASYMFVLGHALAGRVLYVRRDRRSLATLPELDAEHVIEEVDTAAVDALMVDLHRLCGVDHVDRAGKLLEAFLRDGGYAFDERMHQRLQVFHDNRLLLEHSWHYLDRLLAANKTLRGWLLLRNALDIDPLFRPGTAAAVMALIAAAPSADARYVDTLLADFERAYPGSEQLPEALFEHARWSVTQLGQADRALELIARIEQEFPEWAEHPEFRSFSERVRRYA